MVTKSNEIQQSGEKLTARQKKAIPFIVETPTYTEGCKQAKLDRNTFDKWLEKQQKAISSQAIGMLAISNQWLSDHLHMGSPTYVSLLIGEENKRSKGRRKYWRQLKVQIDRHEPLTTSLCR